MARANHKAKPDSLPDPVELLGQFPGVSWTTDDQLRFTSSQGVALAGLGLKPQQINGTSLFEFFQTDDTNFPAISAHLRALRGDSACFVQRWAGNEYQSHVAPLRDPGGAIVGCIGMALDVTELKREEREARQEIQRVSDAAAEALSREQEFSGHIIRSAPNLICAISPEGVIRSVNPAVERVTGYTAAELFERNWWTIFYPGELYAQVERLYVDLQQGPVQNYDMVLMIKDGSLRTISWNSVNRFDRRGNLTEIIGVGVDVTDRKRLEQALLERQATLKQLLEVYDRERRLTSLDLHDGMLPYMTGAIMHLQGIEPVVRTNPDRVANELARSIYLLQEAVAEARRVMTGLRPPVLDDLGVVAAIDYLVSEARKWIDIVEFENSTTFGRLAPALENTIFRIAQESLNNVVRHSEGQWARVELTESPEHVTLRITDQGQGFEISKVPVDRFGLRGIRERAELLNAKASIRSKPGQGTTVEVEFPKIPAEDD